MPSPDDQPPSSLPLWIALACCATAAFLVFGNTIPAMQERERLNRVEDDLVRLMRSYENDIRIAQLSGARRDGAPDLDLQSLFVAIDQKGMTVAEFCAAHPSDGPDEPAGAPPRGR